MKSNKELTMQIVTALEKFNDSEKALSDKIILKASLLSVIPEIGTILLEGEPLTHTDYERKCLCEYVDEIITLDDEIPSYMTSIYGSGCLGYQMLGDSYTPNN